MKLEYIISEQYPIRHWELPFKLCILSDKICAVEFPYTFEVLNKNEQKLSINVSEEWFVEVWNSNFSIGVEHFSETGCEFICAEDWQKYLKERFENAYEDSHLEGN